MKLSCVQSARNGHRFASHAARVVNGARNVKRNDNSRNNANSRVDHRQEVRELRFTDGARAYVEFFFR